MGRACAVAFIVLLPVAPDARDRQEPASIPTHPDPVVAPTPAPDPAVDPTAPTAPATTPVG